MKFDYAIQVLENAKKDFWVDNDMEKELEQAIELLKENDNGK
jgi:hypothetical protein